MSNIYIQEPPTQGKVLLKTTVGDIDIELWSKETPKACRNFIQLCLEGYYNGTIFHRIIKGFIAQGGDPTGSGTGGESIYGEPFKDEVHSRLRFNRRGLVAMANAGKNDNGSQFFFTLGSTPELQNKHTIFGKITGETIYNLLKLDETLVDHDDRPVYPPKILKTEVINNPFPDIIPRISEKVSEEKEEKKQKKSNQSKAVKNYKLLSFGEEAEEDEEEAVEVSKKFSSRGKSSHDVLEDPLLSKELAVDMNEISQSSSAESSDKKQQDQKALDHIREKLSSSKSKLKSVDKNDKEDSSESSSEEYEFGKELKEERKKKLEDMKREFHELKKSYQKSKKKSTNSRKSPPKEDKKPEEKDTPHDEYQQECSKYKTLKEKTSKKGASREEFTLAWWAKSNDKLKSVKDQMGEESEKEDVDDEMNDKSWMAHKLQCESNEPVLAKDANTKSDDWFEIYDPRNPINKRRRDMSKEQLNKKEKRMRD